MMRYLQFDTLEENGHQHFDSWAATFGEKVTSMELKPEGTGFRSKTRFARFYNLPELMSIWKEAADIQSADMLSITSDGRKLALDQRLQNPLLPDDPNSKVNACVKNIFAEWQNSLEGHIICVDPGHCVTPDAKKGYREPVSPLSDQTKPRYLSGTSGKTMTEEKLNLAVGLKLRDALEALGAEVVMTREVSEISLPNTERCRIANESGADVHVHIHADGSTDKTVHGVSVLIPSGDLLGTPSIVDESARLGRLMVDRVAEATGAQDRGTIPRGDLTGLNFSEIPSVFIEMGFMTNPEEDALLSSGEYQDRIVAGMVDSLLDWYGVQR